MMTQNPPVLFVDDDENLLMGLKRKLRGKFEVDTAVGPLQALDKIKAGRKYAVCVADMRMPEMDGVQLLAEVAKLSPDTVNMMLTGLGFEAVNWFGDPQNALFTITLLRCWQFGSAMVIFLAALQSIDKSLYEAAAIDGASKARSFVFITIPLITPVIFFNLIMQMVQAFQEFNGPYIITQGGPLKSTYLLPLYIYDEAFKSFDMGYASAIAWVLFLIIMALTLVAFWSSKKWVFYAGDKRS